MSTFALRAGPVSARIERRTAVTCGLLMLVTFVLAFIALCRGAQWDSPSHVIAALAGGDGSVVVRDWRLPRVLAAVVFGAVLGLAGAIFQNVTRNALGSPDVIGLDAGAYTGALIVITMLSASSAQLATGSLIGGLLAAAAIYLLALKSGFSGLRLIVIGIAMNAMLTAVNSWIVLRADLEVAIAASFWSAGSLNGIGWKDVWLPCVILAVLVLVLMTLWRGMAQASLGDELAVTSGVSLSTLRVLLVVVGVGLTAIVTAVTGPIVFIALAAPQIGLRLAGAAGVPLIPAALTGALLLLAADLISQLLIAPASLPVGVITTAIGGGYLLYLLVKGRPIKTTLNKEVGRS